MPGTNSIAIERIIAEINQIKSGKNVKRNFTPRDFRESQIKTNPITNIGIHAMKPAKRNAGGSHVKNEAITK